MGRIGFEVKQLLQPFLDRGPFCIGDYVNRAITVLSDPCEQFFQEHGGSRCAYRICRQRNLSL
jgi:hypothetical protein